MSASYILSIHQHHLVMPIPISDQGKRDIQLLSITDGDPSAIHTRIPKSFMRGQILNNRTKVITLLEHGVSLDTILSLQPALRDEMLSLTHNVAMLIRGNFPFEKIVALNAPLRSTVLAQSYAVVSLKLSGVPYDSLLNLNPPLLKEVLENHAAISKMLDKGIPFDIYTSAPDTTRTNLLAKYKPQFAGLPPRDSGYLPQK